MQFVAPIPFKEAEQRLGQKTIVSVGLNTEGWRQIPLALRDRALFSAQIENVKFLQRMRELLNDFVTGAREEIILPDGSKTTALKVGSRAQFIELAREAAIAEGLGDQVDPDHSGTVRDITSAARLGLVFDVQTQSAHDYGSWKQGMQPDVLAEFPAQRFIREVDVTTPRPLHLENEGVIRLKTDLGFWLSMNSPSIGGFGVPWGPWGFNSGMGVEDVDRDAAEAEGLIEPGEPITPAELEFNSHLKASVQGLSPDLIARLRATFGDQVEMRGGEIRWVGKSAGQPLPAPQPLSAPAPRAKPAPKPKPAPAAEPPKPPSSSPVSKAMRMEITDPRLRAKVEGAIAAIDQVHDDGKLEPIPVRQMRLGNDSLGHIRTTKAGQVVELAVHSDGPWPKLTTAHEIGHVLDLVALGKPAAAGQDARFATDLPDGPLAPVMEAIRATQAFAQLQNSHHKAFARELRAHVTYLLKPVELWARAYAQFVATQSDDPELKADLKRALANPGIAGRQWQPDDFVPVAAAIVQVFRSLGWL